MKNYERTVCTCLQDSGAKQCHDTRRSGTRGAALLGLVSDVTKIYISLNHQNGIFYWMFVSRDFSLQVSG